MTLGFLELATSQGEELFLVAGAVMAIQKAASEDYTVIKTPQGDFTVTQVPAEILGQYQLIVDQERELQALNRKIEHDEDMERHAAFEKRQRAEYRAEQAQIEQEALEDSVAKNLRQEATIEKAVLEAGVDYVRQDGEPFMVFRTPMLTDPSKPGENPLDRLDSEELFRSQFDEDE